MDPTLITAIATLVTAVTALIKVLQVERLGRANRDTLGEVKSQTNGTLQRMQQTVADMHAMHTAGVNEDRRIASPPAAKP